jgi:T5SS/PEP-CTERM-associated repeat protein
MRRSGILGELGGSTGTATIEGAGSIWTASGYDIQPGDFIVGAAGHGILNIRTGGAVVNNYDDAFLAYGAGSTGEALVTDAGSQWNVDRDLYVGRQGAGSLTIQNGGAVTSDFAFIGNYDTATGTAIVDGVGSVWTTLSTTVATAGDGSLEVRNGGAYVSGDVYMADDPGATATVTVSDPGSSLTAGGPFGYLIVGGSSTANLSILDGAHVNAQDTFVGDGFTGNGTILIDGPGSHLDSPGQISLGFQSGSIGAMTIQNGASASTDYGLVGYDAGANGTATVSGAGSSWTIANILHVGGGAAASLNVMSGGFVDVAGAATITGVGVATLDGGTLEAATLNVNGGQLRGKGTVTAAVTNAGTVSPGASPGILNITGAYTQSAAGMLKIELGGPGAGTGYDRLAISGAASLAGTMEVSFINGYVPSGSTSFTILTAASVSGTFPNVAFVNLPSGRSASVTYTANSVRLDITGATAAGDLNCDGAFDVGDVQPFALALTNPAAYQAAFPSCDISRADIDGNGSPNGHDVADFTAALLAP